MDCASVGSGFFGIVVPPGGGRSQSFTSMLCSQGLDFSVADATGALPEESGHRRDVLGVRWGSTTTEEDAEACNKIISDYRRRRPLQASNYRDERYATVWASRVHWRSPSFERNSRSEQAPLHSKVCPLFVKLPFGMLVSRAHASIDGRSFRGSPLRSCFRFGW